ncbi:MAG: hypothetical protein EXS38_06510 [Opitutus sp.]|nr:hypothetical protein [Opitutus sp.]
MVVDRKPVVHSVPPVDEFAASTLYYAWDGTFQVPELQGAELHILVEGDPQVVGTTRSVSVVGRPAKVRPTGSAGQFGAASQPSPDNWKWFIVPVSPGDNSFVITLNVPLEKASIGVYLHGFTPADSDPAPEEGPVFPLYRNGQRAWSRTLQPLTTYKTDSP